MAQWDETFDFVVVGAGGGGLTAALVAKDAGRSVVVLESTDKLGGSTAMSGGVLWQPNHPLQAADGVQDSHQQGLDYLRALNTDDTSPLRFRRDEAFMTAGPQTVQYLIDKGVPMRRCEGWSDYHDEMPGGCARSRSLRTDMFDLRKLGKWKAKFRRSMFPIPLEWPETQRLPLIKRTLSGKLYFLKVAFRVAWMRLTGQELVGSGSALQGRMLQQAIKAGIDLRTEHPVTEVVFEGDRVEGVVVNVDGKPRRIRGRAGVLLTAGGFAHNDAMRQKYGPKARVEDWSLANPGDDGSILTMMMNHGADTAFLDNAIWLVTSKQPSGARVFHLNEIGKPHSIMVGAHGKRVTNENTSYMHTGNNMFKNGGVPAWVIMESRHRDRYMWGMAFGGKTPPEWLSSGYMKKADTLEELAQACGIDPAGLKATVERFNGFAATGKDLDFQRGDSAYNRVWGDPTVGPNPCLGAIEKPPFYAVQVEPGDVGTAGGLVIDEHGQVLKGGQPIPGLYAAGNVTASIFGRNYPGAGASIAASFVFGYIAAKHALRSNAEALAA